MPEKKNTLEMVEAANYLNAKEDSGKHELRYELGH